MTCFPSSESLKFVDKNILYSAEKKYWECYLNLKADFVGVMEWFWISSLQADPGKFQFMVPGIEDEKPFHIYIDKVKLKIQAK